MSRLAKILLVLCLIYSVVGSVMALEGCGPASTPRPNKFILMIHDDTGVEEDLPVDVSWINTTTTVIVKVPANGIGTYVIGDTPEHIGIYGYWTFTASQSYQGDYGLDPSQYGQYWVYHVLYPSGIAFGEQPRSPVK